VGNEAWEETVMTKVSGNFLSTLAVLPSDLGPKRMGRTSYLGEGKV